MTGGVGGASYVHAMSTIPAPSRQSAHLFLDALALYVDSAGQPLHLAATAEALERVGGVEGAIEANYHRMTNRIEVNLGYLFGGLLRTFEWLARELAAARGTSVESVIRSAHDYLES